MFKTSIFSKQTAAPLAEPPRTNGWFRVKHPWILGAAVLQSACSLLIRVDDGLEEEVDLGHAQGGSTSETEPPDAGPPQVDAGGSSGDGGSTAGASGSAAAGSGPIAGAGGSGGTDAQAGAAGDGGVSEPPIFDLAFVEDPEESEARLQLVNTNLALSSFTEDAAPAWRVTLRPGNPLSNVLDFAWSPDGERIAVRFEGERGPRLAFFAAPDWHEIARSETEVLAESAELAVLDNYRWSPSGEAIAIELSGGSQPLVSGYVIESDVAFGIEPVAFPNSIETADWLSATSLYLIESVDEEPVLRELRLTAQRSFERGQAASDLGLIAPIALRHVPGGVIAASDDPFNFLFFWPASSDEGAEAAYPPWAYLSDDESFVSIFDEETGATIRRIGQQSSSVDSLPGCATVLGWASGPDRRSIAGSKLACLPPEGEPAVISIHSHDANATRSTLTIDDETLRADLAVADNWEGHARALSPDGQFLAFASASHDVLIDLRGADPQLRITDAVGQGNTARAFSPSGAFMSRQRGRIVDLVPLSGSPELPARPFSDAVFDMPGCELAHHSANGCGAKGAARRSSLRWSFGRDYAAHLASGEGLLVIGAIANPVSITQRPVSTCGVSCVKQYEFGR